MAPTFSVVIPTYNHADYLKVALKSVLEQTFQDFEVIVVNNYSTDHTLEVVRQTGDRRVQVINYRNDGVIGASRNVGIRASQGEYVAFLDSDDTWRQNKLERVAALLRDDPEVGMVCHNQALVWNGRTLGRSRYGVPRGFRGSLYDYLLLGRNVLSTSATTVARRCLEAVRGFSEDPAFITVEDYDLWLKLARVCRCRFLGEVLGTHRYHTASASANIELHLRNTLAVLDQHFSQCDTIQRDYPRRAVLRRYADAFYGAARQYQKQEMSARSALGHYGRAFRTYPLHWKVYAGLGLLLADMALRPGRWLRGNAVPPRHVRQQDEA